MKLGLSGPEQQDLEQYLKSLPETTEQK
jgi:hypothetical protein